MIQKEYDWENQFEHNTLKFKIYHPPVSMQNPIEMKKELKSNIQKITSTSKYIITNYCWVYIDYYCETVKRFKNHGAYDIDNIIKPILDSLSGINGIILDDCLFNRVSVNWIDKNGQDEIDVEIEYPDLLYEEKTELILYKNKNWCFPFSACYHRYDKSILDIINYYFDIWNSIDNEDEYNEKMRLLPNQRFIPYNKIKDKGYKIIEIPDV